MSWSAGARVGPYEIVAKLGEGGMGEVYRARDSKLEREVAIKVLPAAFSEDPERLARFEREARVLASLNHPHIAAIYGLEEQDGARALILELVEGPTLAEHLAAGRPPAEQSLAIARQIAEALEVAHEKGIVHRDLKPANVKLAPGGKVKVLDFGLAKALDPLAGSDSSPSQLGHSPTLTLGATMQGVILGTAAYMAPEQARGESADLRADIWAFGVVLFEMLSGVSLFAGPTVSDTLASVLKVEPDLEKLPSDLPAKLRHLLDRCLRKDPRQRLHSIADARIVLEEIQRGELDERDQAPDQTPAAVPKAPLWRRLLPLLGAAAIGALALFSALSLSTPPSTPLPVVRFDIPAPAELPVVGSPKISPDGLHIAFPATDETGVRRIWLRSMDSLEARPLVGSEGLAFRPFWSPDSRSLAFFADGKLKKIALAGGPAQTLCDAPSGADGTWGENGLILYDGDIGDPIRQVSAGGGTPTPLIAEADVDGDQVGWPQYLPGARQFLFVSIGTDDVGSKVQIADADGGRVRTVLTGLSRVEFAPPDLLLFVRDETLVAQEFDVESGALTGEPVPVAEGLGIDAVGLADFSASRNGVLAYRSGQTADHRLLWLDREGREIGEIGEPGGYGDVDISPDGRRIVYELDSQSGRDIWVRDLERGVSSRLTFSDNFERDPFFSADGRRVIYSTSFDGGERIVARNVDGTGDEAILLEAEHSVRPGGVSTDGARLAFNRRSGATFDQWVLDLGTEPEARPIAASEQFFETSGHLSPNGRWVAYESNESGRVEVYVRSAVGESGKWQVSTRGGAEPYWGPDGRALYYLSLDNELTRVAVSASGSFQPGIPESLFRTPLSQGGIRRRYQIAPDGERVLVNAPLGGQTLPPTTVVMNWTTTIGR